MKNTFESGGLSEDVVHPKPDVQSDEIVSRRRAVQKGVVWMAGAAATLVGISGGRVIADTDRHDDTASQLSPLPTQRVDNNPPPVTYPSYPTPTSDFLVDLKDPVNKGIRATYESLVSQGERTSFVPEYNFPPETDRMLQLGTFVLRAWGNTNADGTRVSAWLADMDEEHLYLVTNSHTFSTLNSPATTIDISRPGLEGFTTQQDFQIQQSPYSDIAAVKYKKPPHSEKNPYTPLLWQVIKPQGPLLISGYPEPFHESRNSDTYLRRDSYGTIKTLDPNFGRNPVIPLYDSKGRRLGIFNPDSDVVVPDLSSEGASGSTGVEMLPYDGVMKPTVDCMVYGGVPIFGENDTFLTTLGALPSMINRLKNS